MIIDILFPVFIQVDFDESKSLQKRSDLVLIFRSDQEKEMKMSLDMKTAQKSDSTDVRGFGVRGVDKLGVDELSVDERDAEGGDKVLRGDRC